ncbi:MAG TPA: PspC domain-containing protein, partial [Flavisolibacter sp.]|nr:PspC domain-containing protein [Flavisolibacter sp.]
MKRIININLSGRVIPIEDAAYESLQRYIDSLRRYFASDEGRDEIINDIESRIAELMDGKVKKGATAVTEADINEIIGSMGSVEDFEAADAAETSTTAGPGASYAGPSPLSSGKRARGRLYRDRSDKFLGGVCAGIASYMNVDPAIVRLLFAIVTLGGFGAGILIYILLWIILPAKDMEGYVGKRLFRNPEDRIIGGVSGGIAAYFNKETWMIRLIFAAPLILNIIFSTIGGIFNNFDGPDLPDLFIGSMTGTFFLAYIVLWIVLPEARSPFEKMEMRGEKVDVNRIRQNVQEGMGDFKSRASAWGQEVKESAQNLGERATQFAGTRGRTFAAEVGQTARPVANGIGHAIGVLFKSFFLFVAGVISFALFVIVIVFTVGGVARPFNDFLLNGFWQSAFLWGTLIFFLAVPLIAIITWIVRRLMKVRSQNRYLGWTFGGLWSLGWVCLVMFIASMTKDWRVYDKTEQEVPVASRAYNKMIVRVDEPVIRYTGSFDWISDNEDGGFDITEDTIRLSDVKVRVDKSPDSFYYVTSWRYSAGRNRGEARKRAEAISYKVSTLDSALILGSGFGVGKAQKYRGQKVIVEIKVPVGKMIRFDESVAEKLNYTNIRIAER